MTRVLLIVGGVSSEHEISLLSAQFVGRSLLAAGYAVDVLGIRKNGSLCFGAFDALGSAAPDPRTIALPDSFSAATLLRQDGRAVVDAAGRTTVPDVAFPTLHGPMGEDGTLQGWLELIGLPYVGCGVLASAAAMDKDVSKRLFRDAELPVLPWETVLRRDWAPGYRPTHPALQAFPLFVKPARQGSSVGVSKVESWGALDAAMQTAFSCDSKVIVEAGVERPRELECSVLGYPEPRTSVVGELQINASKAFYTYEAKYLDPNGATQKIPAQLHPQEQSAIQLLALKAFRTLDAKGLARVDFLFSANGELYLNEVNTLPGFTAISMYPKMWEASGVGAVELMRALVADALAPQ